MKLARNLTIAAAAVAALMAVGCKKEAPQAAAPAFDMPGQAVYFQQCAICHGRFGKGDTMIAANYPWANLADSKYGHGSSREEILKNITEGIPQTPMRGFKGALTDEELGQITDYVIAMGKQSN
jgi:mono/diheme cytochrome c family protein